MAHSWFTHSVTCLVAVLVCTIVSCSSQSNGGNGDPATDAGAAGSGGSPGCSSSCDDGFACTVDVCVNGSCKHSVGPNSGSTACPSGQFCTVDKGCVANPPCAKDQQCQDLWKDDACKTNIRCDAATSVCLFDALDKDHDGHAPAICGGDDCDDANADIHPGATETCNGKDDDCDGQVDNGATCSGLAVCTAGSCVCPPANTCGATCSDLTSDADHCGSCGNACKPGEKCVNSACQCAGTMCNGVCTDTTNDSVNCGACGHACQHNLEYCSSGACTCGIQPGAPSNGTIPVVCNGTCMDTAADDANCGGCGIACSTGTSCVWGHCH